MRAEERRNHWARSESEKKGNIPMPGPGDMQKTEPGAAVEKKEN